MNRAFPAALVLAVLITWCPRSDASPSVVVSPPNPTTADTVRVTVGDEFVNTSWTWGGVGCAVQAPDTLHVTVPVQYCFGHPTCMYQDVIRSFSSTCAFGPLPAGTYVALFDERHVNPYDPLPSASRAVLFTVSAATPALRRSWGAIKSIYR